MAAKKPSRKWFYLLFGIAIVIGTSLPVSIPMGITPYVKSMWQTIEALPEGSNVIVAGWFGGSHNMYCMKVVWPAVWHQLMRKHLHIIISKASVDEERIANEILRSIYGVVDIKDHPLYGKEIVDFGVVVFTPAVMIKDWTVMIKIDKYGNLLTDYDKLPMMKTFKGWGDSKLIFSGGEGVPLDYHLKSSDAVLVHAGDTWGWARENNQYYTAGLLKGMVMGIKQAGQYEMLEGTIGDAYKYLLVETLTGLIIIGALLVGSVSFIYKTRYAEVKKLGGL